MYYFWNQFQLNNSIILYFNEIQNCNAPIEKPVIQLIIFQNIVTFVFCIDTFGRVLAASFSNVYFQLGANGVPASDVVYGTTAINKNSQAQLAPLTIPSSMPLVPVTTLVAPCPMPCISPGQPVGNANLVYYKQPNKLLDDVSILTAKLIILFLYNINLF